MNIDSRSTITFAEAESNFSRVAQMVERYGVAVVTRDNEPLYLVVDFHPESGDRTATNEEVFAVSQQLMERYHTAYQELAK